MRSLYHIVDEQEWQAAVQTEVYTPASFKTEMFIHLCRPHQLNSVLQKWIDPQRRWLLLQLRQEDFSQNLRYESVDGDWYPHLYSSLKPSQVLRVHKLDWDGQQMHWPPNFQLMGQTLLRPGEDGDEPEIASVHTHAWQESYRQILPAEVLEQQPLCFRQRLLWWKKSLNDHLSQCVFVAESAQHGIVGFCSGQMGRDPELFPEAFEITTLYLLEAYKGLGLGKALLNQALEFAQKQGYLQTYLWVLSENPSRFFYEHCGAKTTSHLKKVEIGRPVDEIAMLWRTGREN